MSLDDVPLHVRTPEYQEAYRKAIVATERFLNSTPTERRLDAMESRLASLEAKFDSLIDVIDELSDLINERIPAKEEYPDG